MVHEELFARLNEAGYKNWLKAGFCLLKVKEGLCGFADNEMRHFHDNVVNSNVILQRRQTCRNSCRTNGNQFQMACPICNEWKNEILRHHTKPCGVINWGNCRPWLWPSEPWEVAKAFMPRGLAHVMKVEQCDAAALLNLLRFCDHFSYINQNLLAEVIHCRNELMHSCEMQVSDQWMARFQKSLEQLLLQLRHVPGVTTVGHQIREMLSVELLVHVPGMDYVDAGGPEGVGIESISHWERELLRESVKDLLFIGNDEETPAPSDLKKVQNLYGFLSGHQDLEEHFRTELQSIHTLEKQLSSINNDLGEK